MSAAVAAITRPETIVAEAGLSTTLADSLLAAFGPAFSEACKLAEEASALTVTDATQVSEMKQARALRLKLRTIRTEAEKVRKSMKEESLRTGKAIDNVYGAIRLATEPVEARLQDMEDFAARAEAARKAALKDARVALLAPYGIDTSFVDLANMPETTFLAMLEQAKTAHQAKIAAAAQAEADRIAREKADAEERARIAAENARLKQEAEAREAAARKEREEAAAAARAAEAKARKEREAIEAKSRAERTAAEIKLKAEREAREAAERKERDRIAAERKASQDAEAARARALAAPDADKLRAYADALVAVECPEMASSAGKLAAQAFGRRVGELARSIVTEADRISK